jgi:hypothetical protein
VKLFTVSPPYKYLVANFTGQYDELGNPIKARTYFEQQLVYGPEVSTGLVQGATAPSLGSITVVDNDFSTGEVILYLGEYEFLNGEHYLVGAADTDTANNLAALINNLKGYSASVSGGTTVDIEGPPGPLGGNIMLDVEYFGTIQNFTLSPTSGFLTAGGPSIGPVGAG